MQAGFDLDIPVGDGDQCPGFITNLNHILVPLMVSSDRGGLIV